MCSDRNAFRPVKISGGGLGVGHALVVLYNVLSCAAPALPLPPQVHRAGPFANSASFFIGQKELRLLYFSVKSRGGLL
jgi:hypothetical protein